MLKFKIPEEDPGGDHKWRANCRVCKMVRPGPPNQYFFSKTPRHKRGKQQSAATPPNQQPVNNNEMDGEERSDVESDVKQHVENQQGLVSSSDEYFVQWDKNFIDNISIDQRGQQAKMDARLQQHASVEFFNKLAFFKIMSPTKYYEEHLLPATNIEMRMKAYDEMEVGEFYGWLGIWFLLQLHPGYQTDNFFLLDRGLSIGTLPI